MYTLCLYKCEMRTPLCVAIDCNRTTTKRMNGWTELRSKEFRQKNRLFTFVKKSSNLYISHVLLYNCYWFVVPSFVIVVLIWLMYLFMCDQAGISWENTSVHPSFPPSIFTKHNLNVPLRNCTTLSFFFFLTSFLN